MDLSFSPVLTKMVASSLRSSKREIFGISPKGVAHNVQGLDNENEYLLGFDDGDFEKIG